MAEHWSVNKQEYHNKYGYNCPICHPEIKAETYYVWLKKEAVIR